MKVVYDFTLFEDDGVTPWFGSADVYGEIVESDFQTPDPTLAHDRPHLRVPEGFSPTEVDFLNGASRIGAGSIGVLDKRITAADQTTGLVTSRIQDAPGHRALLRRWIPATETWRTLFDGVVQSYTVDPDELLVYWFHVRDAREFEREQPLFKSNHVLFGAGGKQGPAVNYGRLPGGGFLLEAVVQPLVTTFHSQFGVGFADLPASGVATLGLLGMPTQDADGLWRHRGFRLAWRPAGSPDGTLYTILDNMPAFGPIPAIIYPNSAIGPAFGALFSPFPTIIMTNPDPADPTKLPADGAAIEILAYAVEITPEAPFWWDGGTLGDLLEEIVAGLHTAEPPREKYDTAALAAFALSSRPARFKLTAPVPDRRKWVEENIYKPSFTAPAFNLDYELRPVPWRVPTLAQLAGAPVLDGSTIQPIGEWEHGVDNAVGEIEYTYIRESVEPTRTITDPGTPPGWKFWASPHPFPIDDPEDTRIAWQRLVETPVTVITADPGATPGAGQLAYKPVTIRSIAGTSTAPPGPDAVDELGNQLVEEASATVFPRFRKGAPKYSVDVTATPANFDLYDGQFVLVRFAPLPNYATGKRGLSRWMQIYAISDPSPAVRHVQLVDTGATDVSEDPDVVDPTYAGCLTGGEVAHLPSGKAALVFRENGFLTNTCDHPVTLSVLIVAGGGGGGGGVGGAGGGGGAGGVLGVTTPIEVEIAPGAVIPIIVGAGGVPGAMGGDSVVWMDGAGEALDPDVDAPLATLKAFGGGYGSEDAGASGGSGGGGGGVLPISGGGVSPAGGGTVGQGRGGGAGSDLGGIATCRAAVGGGGGSFIAPGQGGFADTDTGSEGGEGGPAFKLEVWGITLGGGGKGGAYDKPEGLGDLCSSQAVFGIDGEGGHGAGGGGGANGPGGSGTDGIMIVAFLGAAPELKPPVITPTVIPDTNQVEVCISEANWPEPVPEGYRVRVEYAAAALEPAASSGKWLLAGYLNAPGCVTSVAVPTGSNVWTRAIAESDALPPSEPSVPETDTTPETPGLVSVALFVDDAGVVTLRWEPNAWALGVRIRGLTHVAGASTDRPLALIADADAAAGTYTIPGTVPVGGFETIDVEAWDGYGPDPATAVPLEDGLVSRNSPVCNGTWAAARGGAGTEVQRVSTVVDVRISTCNTSTFWAGLWRGIFSWNVAGYIDTSTVTGAVLQLRVLAKTESLAGQSIALVGATPAAPALLVAADYAQLGAVLYSDAPPTLASIGVDTFITFVLNAAGLAALQAAIAAGGSFVVGLRIEADRTNAEPAWSINKTALVQVASKDHPTAAYRPALLVTTAPVLSGTVGNTYRVSAQRRVPPAVTWASITGTPTTLAGYGIIDAASDAELAVFAGALAAHLVNVANPHAVTKAQVGLGAVENTALSTWAGSAAITTVGALVAGGVPYGLLTGPPPTWNQNTTGSAATLTTPRTINGVAFNGSANITVPAAAGTLTGTINYANLPTGGGTWANGGALTITGGVTNVAGLASTGDITTTGVVATSALNGVWYAEPTGASAGSAVTLTLNALSSGSPGYNTNGAAIQLQSGAAGADGTILFSTNKSGIGSATRLTIANTGLVTVAVALAVGGGFGCNTKAPQTAFASGGAAAGTATSAGWGFVSAAEMNGHMTLVANIRTALVNNGVMS